MFLALHSGPYSHMYFKFCPVPDFLKPHMKAALVYCFCTNQIRLLTRNTLMALMSVPKEAVILKSG